MSAGLRNMSTRDRPVLNMSSGPSNVPTRGPASLDMSPRHGESSAHSYQGWTCPAGTESMPLRGHQGWTCPGAGQSAGRAATNVLHEQAQHEAHQAVPRRHCPGRGGRSGRGRRRPVRRGTDRRVLHHPGNAPDCAGLDVHRLHAAVDEGLCHCHVRHQRQGGALRRDGRHDPAPRVRARHRGVPEVGAGRGRCGADGRRDRGQRGDAGQRQAGRCHSLPARHRGGAGGAAAPDLPAVAACRNGRTRQPTSPRRNPTARQPPGAPSSPPPASPRPPRPSQPPAGGC